jgi:hypothetical protein
MTLSIVRGSETFDLLEGGDGFKLALNGWTPAVTYKESGEYIHPIETITLNVSGTSHNNLANRISALSDEIREGQDRIDDPVATDAAYLRWKLPNETAARQALIEDLRYELGDSPYFPPVINHSHMRQLRLSITRRPFWEDIDATNPYWSNVYTYGYLLDTGSTSAGDASRRLWLTSILAGQGSLTEMWMGFRTSRYGEKTQLRPVWTCTDGTGYNNTTASGGDMVWTPGGGADNNLLARLIVRMEDTLAPASVFLAQRGTFTVLLRAKSTDATRTFYARLSDGFAGSAQWNTHSRVEVSGTNYLLYNLGTVTIPPMSLRYDGSVSTILKDYALRIEAEEGTTSGSGNLSMERFVLIPQTEGFCHIKGMNLSTSARAYVYTEVDERLSAYSVDGTDIDTPTEFDVINYSLPRDDFCIVFAAQGAAQVLTDYVTISMSYFPRWYSFRGTT